MNTSTFQTQQVVQTQSQRSHSSARSPASASNGGTERKKSVTNGHYRQGSKLQGPYHHSRNASFVNSPATSPLSPQPTGGTAANAGLASDFTSLTMIYHGAHEHRAADSSSGTVDGSMHTSSTSTLVGDRDAGDIQNTMLTQRRIDRTHSSRTRREHGHQRSQSRQQEQKTVGEYALHHLFNSVSDCIQNMSIDLCDVQFVRQADYKINQCVTGMLDEDFRVERICGPGVDPEFDQLISALGHIARQKPKPLIDTIMYWRKAKGEAATNAKAEVNHVGLFSPRNSAILITLRQNRHLHQSICSGIFLGGTQSRRICCTPVQAK